MSNPRKFLGSFLTVGSLLLVTRAQADSLTYTPGEVRTTAYVLPPSLDLQITSYQAWQTGAISGNGSVNLLGPGSILLSGTNTYTGNTTVTAGTLQFGKTASLYNGDVSQWTKLSVLSGTTAAFNVGGAGEFTSANIAAVSAAAGVFKAGSRLALDTSTANSLLFTLSNDIAAADFGVTKIGLGTLALSGSNNFAGGFTIGPNYVYNPGIFEYGGTGNSSRVVLASAGALGSSGTIVFQGGSLQFTAANTTDYSARFSQASGQLYNFDTNGQNVTFATGLNTSSGRFTKTGLGTLTLGGSNSQPQVGIQGGTLRIATGTVLTSTNTEVVDGALLIAGGTVNSDRAFVGSDGRQQSLFGNGVDRGYLPTGSLSGSATLSSGNWTVSELGIGNYGQTGTVTITGGNMAAGSVFVGGSYYGNDPSVGTLNLSGNGVITASSFSVGWTHTSGTANISGGSLTVADTLTLGSLFGPSTSAELNLSAGTVSAKTINVGAQTYGTLNVSGGVLSGTDGMFVGTAATRGSDFNDRGVVNLTNGTINSSVTVRRSVGEGGILNISGGVLNAPTLVLESAAVDHSQLNLSGGVINAGTFTLGSFGIGGTATITGGNLTASTFLMGVESSYTSTLNMSGGSLSVAVVDSRVNPHSRINISGGSLSFGSGIAIWGNMMISGSGLVTLGSGNGTVYLGRDGPFTSSLNLGGATGSAAVPAGTLNAASVTSDWSVNVVNFNQTGSYTFAPKLLGHLSVAKNGAGTTNLSGDNSYDGGTTINAGTLEIGSNTALGSGDITINGGGLRAAGTGRTVNNNITLAGDFTLGRSTQLAGNITLTNNITLTSANPDTNAAAPSTISGAISGAYGLTFAEGANPNGTIILTGNNSYTGGTTLQGGTLQIGDNGTTGSVPGNISTSASLVFKRGDAFNFGGTISGSGTVTQAGGGTLTLSGVNSYTGGTVIANGTTLTVASDDNLGGIAGALSLNGGTLNRTTTLSTSRSVSLGAAGGTFRGIGSAFFSGTFSGAGSLTLGSGLMMINAASAGYTGASIVEGGTLMFLGGSLADTPATSGIAINAGTLIFSGSLTYGGPITGAGQMTHESPGTTVLTGTASHTGGTLINGGALQIDNGGYLSGNVNIASGRFIINRSGGNVTYSNAISGAGMFQKDGAGLVTLTGNNSYTGGTTLQGGTLQIGDNGTTGSVVGNISTSASLVFKRGDAFTFGGTISGSGSVTQAGGGALTLSGNNSYTGGTVIANGTTLTVASDANLGEAASPLSLNGGTLNTTTAGFFPSRNVSLGAAGGTFRLNGFSAFSGNISGAGSLTMASGTMVINAAAADYTGASIIEGGILKFQGSSFADTPATSGIVISAGKLYLGGNFTYGGPITGAGQMVHDTAGTTVLTGTASHTGGTLISGGAIQLGNGSVDGNLSGDITINNVGKFILNRSGGNIVFANAISGAGVFQKSGAGLVTLSGNNTYSGGTVLNGGLINFTSNANLGSGDITMNGGGLQWATGNTIDISSRLDAIGSSGATFDTNGNNITFASILTGGKLTKSGAGTLNLSRTNTYSGGTIVNAGTLELGADNALGSGPLTINGGSVRAGGAPRTLTNAVTLAGNFTLGRATNFAGNVTMTADITITSANPDSSAPTRSSFSGVIAGSKKLTFTEGSDPTGTIILSGANTYSGGTTISAGTLQVGADGTSGSVGSGNVTNNGTLIFQRSDSFTVANGISGTGSVVQAGNGTTILTSINTHSGGTTISAGTLQVGAGGTTGNLSGNVINQGTLAFDRSDALTFAGTITGAGAVTKLGAGTLTLSGNNSYNGGLTITAGTLELGNDHAAGADTGTITITGGGIRAAGTTRTLANPLALNGSFTLGRSTHFTGGAVLGADITITSANPDTNVPATSNFSGVISGNHGVTLTTGANPIGAIIFSGANTYTGNTSVQAGTLVAGNSNGSATGSGAVTVGGAGTLNVGLAGAHGAVSGPVTVTSGGTLKGYGSTGALVIGSGGTLAPGNSPGIITTTGNVSLGSGSNSVFVINGPGTADSPRHTTAGTDYSQEALTGSLTIDGAATLTLTGLTGLVATNAYVATGSSANLTLDNYFVFNLLNTGTVTGRFTTINGVPVNYSATNRFTGLNGLGGFFLGGQEFAISYQGNYQTNSTLGGNDVVVTAIPEPTTWALLFGSMGMLLLNGRRRRSGCR